MKWIVIFLALIGLGAVVIFRQPTSSTTSLPSSETEMSTKKVVPPDTTVTIGNRTLGIYSQPITSSLILIPNFDEKKAASKILEEHTCQYGVNGGFYTKDYKPIGLFITNGQQHSAVTSDPTFNAFLVNIDGKLSITRSVPDSTATFALQSGPYMTPTITLRLRNDSAERRMMVARTTDNHWYFIAMTEINNTFSGPNLADVPKILGDLPIDVAEALNLDGGSASAFYSASGVHLGELTLIGSLLCGNSQ